MQCVFPFPQDRYGFAPIEKGIADGAIADAFSFQLPQPRDLRCQPGAAGCKDDRFSFKTFFRRLHYKACKIIVHGKSHNFPLNKFHAQTFGPCNAVGFQLRAGYRLCQPVVVFNFFRFRQSPAATGDYRNIRPGALSVQRGGNAGRAAADNDNIHVMYLPAARSEHFPRSAHFTRKYFCRSQCKIIFPNLFF